MLKHDKTCTCGNTTHERTLNENLDFVWECTKCHKTSPYRNKSSLKRNQKFEGVEVTTPQKKTLSRLKKDILEEDGGDVEFKEFLLDEGAGGSIYLTVITGKPDDDGTVSYLTDRKTRNFFISERGETQLIYSDF